MDPDFCDGAGGGIAYSSSWILRFGKNPWGCCAANAATEPPYH